MKMMMVTVLTKPGSSKRLVRTAVFCLCLFIAVATQAQKPAASGAEVSASFTTFDVSAAGKGAYEGTYGLSINSAGTITGYYIDSKFAYHGFVRTPSGTITTFDAPGAGKEIYDGTFPFSINAAGEIAG
jgi:hypothetical protein